MKRISETEHDKIVRDAVDYLTMQGFLNIKADLNGYVQPKKITWTATGKGHIPDVTAQSSNLLIFEVETADSISHAHTADQWKLFSAYANQHGAIFWVVIPKGFDSDARSRLNQLGIQAKIWEL